MQKRLSVLRLTAVLTMVLVASQSGFARYQPKPGRPNFFSVEQEVQVGREESAKVDRSMPLVTDPALNRYVQDIGARLAAKAPPPKYPFEFKIINQKEINAFALPGGPIYINLGTIQAADNEAQLAGVMAHEMSHIIMRHSTHMASQQMLAQAPLSIIGGLLGSGTGGQLAQMGINFLAGSVFLKYSRDAEKQADLVGAGIMHDAGYNPIAMVEFFRKLEQEGGASGPQFFSDHPNPGNRVEYVAAEVKTLPPANYQQNSPQFASVKQRVGGMRGLTAQEIQQRQQQGAVQGGAQGGPVTPSNDVIPSGKFRTLNHSAYSVSYPDNWQVFGDQNSEVTIAPRSGISGNALAYGVIVSAFQPERSGDINLNDATQQLLNQLHQSNPELRRVGNTESYTINGMPARSVMLSGASPIVNRNNKPIRERDWLVTVQDRDGDILYFVFIAPQNDFGRLQPSYEQMLRSLKMRTDDPYSSRSR